MCRKTAGAAWATVRVRVGVRILGLGFRVPRAVELRVLPGWGLGWGWGWLGVRVRVRARARVRVEGY